MKKINFALLGVCMLFVSWLLPSTMTAQGEIKVTVGEKGWFKVEKLEGANISVEGMPAGFTAQTGDKIAQEYQATPKSTITFKGDITGLRIVGKFYASGDNAGNVEKRGDVVKFDASKAPKQLTFLSLKGLNLKSIDLSGATELTATSLIDLAPKMQKLDLSKQNKVKKLYLGNSNYNNNFFEEIVMPSPNVISVLDLGRTAVNKIDLDNLPELIAFLAVGANPGSTGLNTVELKASKKLKYFIAQQAHFKDIILKDKPQLIKLVLFGNLNKSLIIENCPKLKDWRTVKGKDYGAFFGMYGGNYLTATKVKVSGTGLTKIGDENTNNIKNVQDLDISENALTSVSFTPYTKLNKVTMNARQLRNLNAEEVLATLPERKPADNAEFNLLVGKNTDPALIAKIEAELKKKGWALKKTTAVEDLLSISGVKIYPTQTSDLVKIEGAKANMPYAVYAVSGKLCEKGMTDSFGSAEIHLNTYAKGVYLVKLGAKSQKVVLR